MFFWLKQINWRRCGFYVYVVVVVYFPEKKNFLQNLSISNDTSNKEKKKLTLKTVLYLTTLCNEYLLTFPSVKTTWKKERRKMLCCYTVRMNNGKRTDSLFFMSLQQVQKSTYRGSNKRGWFPVKDSWRDLSYLSSAISSPFFSRKPWHRLTTFPHAVTYGQANRIFLSLKSAICCDCVSKDLSFPQSSPINPLLASL